MAAATRLAHFVATVTAAAAPLSSLISGFVLATDDVGCRQISLFVPASGNSGTVYVGGSNGLTTASYGFAMVATGALISYGWYETGPVKLSDIYVVGTAGDKVYITITPF